MASGSTRPCSPKKAAAPSPPKPVVDWLAMRAAFQSVALIQSRQPQRSVSHCALPMWSGCMCVTITRSTGRPSRCLANTCSQAARVLSLATPQSTMAQPSRPSSARSRSNHRLMWSSAKGSGMRSQRTPGASSMTAPVAGSVSPSG